MFMLHNIVNCKETNKMILSVHQLQIKKQANSFEENNKKQIEFTIV